MRLISLFSGYGSQELALKYLDVNFQSIAHCDIYAPANQVFSVLHKTMMGNLGDITKIDETQFPDCDFLTYSFPCQDISISGIQKGIEIGTRSGLLYEVERILSYKQPKYLLMENVKNLISIKHRANFERHIEFLNELGYGCGWCVFNGADYGCPQNRERVLMMSVQGMTNDQVSLMMNQAKENKITRTTMRDFIDTENVPDEFYIDCEIESYTPKKKSICRMTAIRKDVKYEQAQRIYSIDGCSPCLTKTGVPQIMLDNGRVRKITPRESYRFMGVREEDINKMMTVDISAGTHSGLAGNSICVPVMESIFKVFFKCG